MTKVSELCQILLAVAFMCVVTPCLAHTRVIDFNPVKAYQAVSNNAPHNFRANLAKNSQTNEAHNFRANIANASSSYNPAEEKKEKQDAQFNQFIKNVSPASSVLSAKTSPTNTSAKTDEVKTPETGIGTSDKPSASEITGCSKDLGLFSGLITTGKEIFKGLRDLIYVVAGFGIIGVAVGGFFGNLNWKWLGAIVIGLVVIATTGELISSITGCQDFTTSMIEDTLK